MPAGQQRLVHEVACAFTVYYGVEIIHKKEFGITNLEFGISRPSGDEEPTVTDRREVIIQ